MVEQSQHLCYPLGWLQGQAGGDALISIITGKTAPAELLPITQYPAHYAQDVPMIDMGLRSNVTFCNPGRTCKWYSEAVLPFGYDLHYTNFSNSLNTSEATTSSYDIADLISSCDLSTSKFLDLCPFTSLSVSVTDTNTGSTASDYVALAFLAGQHGQEPYPYQTTRCLRGRLQHQCDPDEDGDVGNDIG
jgi:xylan 1,4-beta-xylosidase